MSLNKVMLIGNLGAAPILRETQNQEPVVTMSIATSERWTDKASGEKKERTEWHSVVIFDRNICDFVTKYLQKGMRVYIEGELHTRKWLDPKLKIDKYRTEVVIPRFGGELQSLSKLDPNLPPPVDSVQDYGEEKTIGEPPADLDDQMPF